MGNGSRHEFCCDASYEGWGCTCASRRRKVEEATLTLEKEKLEREKEAKRRGVKQLLIKRIENEYDGRFSEGKIVRYLSNKEGYPTGTIKSVTEDRKSMQILWHNSGEIKKISRSDEITLEVLYSEYEIEHEIPEYEKFSIYFNEYPILKDEDEDDEDYHDYDYENDNDDDYY